MKHEIWSRVADYLHIDIDTGQIARLERYGQWLSEEAIPAGGLGPGEYDRLETRHIADSLVFAGLFARNPGQIRDLGSGVGLPGIPLAVLLPDTHVELVDRSARRVNLLRRVQRVLDLSNVTVICQDLTRIEGSVPVVVSRASLPPARMLGIARRQLDPGGTAVLGGSWRARPDHHGWETVEIPADVLDQTVWLLIMRRQ